MGTRRFCCRRTSRNPVLFALTKQANNNADTIMARLFRFPFFAELELCLSD